jgi:4-hydroxy-tetrahydrodipicolinate synthase
MHIQGVFAAALTPLNIDNSLALTDWPEFLEFLAARGCHGVLLLGTTGEGPSFSLEERVRIVEAAVPIREVYPDFQILVGTGTPSLEETIAINRAVFDLGVDGVVILPPYYYRNPSDEGLFEWFSLVVNRSIPEGRAFLIYHIPKLTGIQFDLDLLERLIVSFPRHAVGIKDSTTDPDFAMQLGGCFGSSLLTFSGTDSIFDTALANSASGCITAMANLRSPDLRRVWDARKQGSVDLEARQRLEKARHMMDRFPPNPPLYKAFIHRFHKMPLWSVRPPLCSLSNEQLEYIYSEIHGELDGFEE